MAGSLYAQYVQLSFPHPAGPMLHVQRPIDALSLPLSPSLLSFSSQSNQS